MSFDFEGTAAAEGRQVDHPRKQLSDEAFRWLMDDPRGRLLVWERLSDAGLFRTSFNTDPCATAFAEGRRDMALRDLNRIQRLCPTLWARMMVEAAARDAAFGGMVGSG
ncbi:MAG: hypothetical protein KIT25_00035 [Enhydrobacter sp.]|nr:MAG: hypothetical protein KIT25_00035 [Enhydrobacter sp.]